jgi:hypothetical protein
MTYTAFSQIVKGSYIGKLKNGLPKGHGTMIYDDRRKYSG